MKLDELHGVLADALEEWALGMVDGFTQGNPKLAMVGVYVKNGIRNYRKREEAEIARMVSNASLFIADEKGEVNVDKVLTDLQQWLTDMDEMPFALGFVDGVIGKGVIRLDIPDNPLMRMLFGDKGALVIGADDFAELRKLMA